MSETVSTTQSQIKSNFSEAGSPVQDKDKNDKPRNYELTPKEAQEFYDHVMAYEYRGG